MEAFSSYRGANMPRQAAEATGAASAASAATTRSGSASRKRKLSPGASQATRGMNIFNPALLANIPLARPSDGVVRDERPAGALPDRAASSESGHDTGYDSGSTTSSAQSGSSSMQSGNTSPSATSSVGRSNSNEGVRRAAPAQYCASAVATALQARPATGGECVSAAAISAAGTRYPAPRRDPAAPLTIYDQLVPRPEWAMISPVDFLGRILRERKYACDLLNALTTSYHHTPTAKHIADYDIAMVTAVRAGDVATLTTLRDSGRSFDACNRYGESVLHMACRRASLPCIEFLVRAGASVGASDDFGRTPLHDACWTINPSFELIEFLCDQDLTLLRVTDCRGSSPLAYARRESWAVWNAFLVRQQDKWWPVGAGDADPAAGAVPSVPVPASMGAEAC